MRKKGTESLKSRCDQEVRLSVIGYYQKYPMAASRQRSHT